MKKNHEQAIEWYIKSANGGYGYAQNVFGILYEEGEIVPQNCTEAAKWYQKAADQGNINGLYNLACLYLYGQEGIEKDYERAFKLFTLAAADHKMALFML